MKKIFFTIAISFLAFGLSAQDCADGNSSNGQPAARFANGNQFYLEWSTDAAAMSMFASLDDMGSINYNGVQVGTGVVVNQTVAYSDLRNPAGNPFRIRTNIPITGITQGGTFSGIITFNFDDGSTYACEYSSGNLLGALPIELISFAATEDRNNIQLEWSTASEINSDFIAVERSSDGHSFQEIGRVPGAGNSITIRNYKFIDSSPQKGTIYYRLRQVDYSRAVYLSEVISVKLKNGQNGFSVYPTMIHADQMATVDLTNFDNAQVQLIVTDLSGLQLMNKIILGGDLEEIEFNSIPSGHYFINIVDGSMAYSNKITVTK